MKGMKMYFLDLGQITVDDGWLYSGGSAATLSNPKPVGQMVDLCMSAALIDHPKVGPILYDCGVSPDYKELWPEGVFQVFPITEYKEEHRLDNALNQIGYDLKDIQAIFISHMHLDHGGGLEFFRGMDVPVYVHELELKYAFYAVATKEDFGAYIPHYIDPSFNWKVIQEDECELFDGIKTYLIPGHTPGTLMFQVDLDKSGSFLFTSDICYSEQNLNGPHPLGWLTRDASAWWKSIRKVHAIRDRLNAKVIIGHDAAQLKELRKEKYYD